MTDGDWRRVATTHSLTTPQVWRRRFLDVEALALYPSVHWGSKRKQKRHFMPWAKGVFTCFSQNSVSTLRDSYGRCKSRAWSGCSLGPRHFTCKFPYQVALVKSWHAFQLRTLAQNVCPCFDCAGSHKVCGAVLVCGILPVNFHIKWLLWNLDMCFHCGGSHKVCGAVGLRHFNCKFPYKVAPCEILTCVSTAHARTKCVSVFRLRRLAQSLRSGFGLRHFTCKFPYKVALVKSWHVFPLRRLAQSLRRGWSAAF